jgi:hypothetical protein
MSGREHRQGENDSSHPGRGQQTLEQLREALRGTLDLSIGREPETQYYHMQTQFIHMGFDGGRTGVETYLLRHRCLPAALSGKKLDEYTCQEFGLKLNDGPFATLPALRSFTYQFDPMSGVLGKGPMFGIPQAPFREMTDSLGTQLPPDVCYAAYNNFVDFHALSDVFPKPMKFVKGVEELKSVGDRIVHPGSFAEAPVSLTGVVRSGSVFRNGELALELKGVSLVDDRPCALVNYDSGESTLRMAFIRGDSEDLMTEGGSEYAGDLYIDLTSGWVRKVTLNEFVVTQTSTASLPNKVPSYTVRHILLRLISEQEFKQPISVLS